MGDQVGYDDRPEKQLMDSMAVEIPEGSSGDWRVEHFSVTQEEADFERLRALLGNGRDIDPGRYTRLVWGADNVIHSTVMSDTPEEKRDHLPFVYHATGHVLINGLGLGMCVNGVLAKRDVVTVTVVELEKDVIDLVAPYITDNRVQIVCADARMWTPPKNARYDAVWHDIWDRISPDNLPDMKKLHRKYGRRAGWQASWCRAQCERLAAR